MAFVINKNHDLGILYQVSIRHIASDNLRLYGQVNKRTWWMPRRKKAMKDVVVCDKPRLADKQAHPGISEWGNPATYGGHLYLNI